MDIHAQELLGGDELAVLSQSTIDELTAIKSQITSINQLKMCFTRALAYGKMTLSHGAIDVDSFDASELQRAQILQGIPSVSEKPDSYLNVCINEQRMLSALVIRL